MCTDMPCVEAPAVAAIFVPKYDCDESVGGCLMPLMITKAHRCCRRAANLSLCLSPVYCPKARVAPRQHERSPPLPAAVAHELSILFSLTKFAGDERRNYRASFGLCFHS